jgi:hypothetical protein
MEKKLGTPSRIPEKISFFLMRTAFFIKDEIINNNVPNNPANKKIEETNLISALGAKPSTLT